MISFNDDLCSGKARRNKDYASLARSFVVMLQVCMEAKKDSVGGASAWDEQIYSGLKVHTP